MATINAFKMDGLGNDFIIIDRRSNFVKLKKEKIVELSDRSNIGFDQIIFIEKEKTSLGSGITRKSLGIPIKIGDPYC